MNSYYRFYVYTCGELGIKGKQIFDELARVHQDHLSVDFRDSDGKFSV